MAAGAGCKKSPTVVSYETTGASSDSGSTTMGGSSSGSTSMEPGTTSTATTSTTATTPGTESSPTTGGTDPDSGSESGGVACIDPGSYIVVLTDRVDPHGHFPFLKLFYAPDGPEQTAEEIFVVDVAPDGTITVELAPRDPGGPEGHAGLADLVGTIDEACEVEIVASTGFESATGPFGTVDVTLTGTFTRYEPVGVAPAGDLTLEGGNIPNGPITYTFEISGQQ